MEPHEALRIVHQAVRQLTTTADVHERLAVAINTLASVVNAQGAAKAATPDPPTEDPNAN